MKKVLLIATIALLAVACNKNQSAVKKLDGKWNVTKYVATENGVTVDYMAFGLTADFNFSGCKLKNDEYCDLTTTLSISGSTEISNQIYRVTNDGETLEIKDSDTSATTSSITILELSKSTLKMQQVEDGVTTDIEAAKN